MSNFENRPLLGEKKESAFINIIIVAFIIMMAGLLIFISLFQLCEVVGKSMEDSLQNGDYVILTNFNTDYKNGDVIVIRVSDDPSVKPYIKRVIFTGGQTFKVTLENNIYRLNLKNADGSFTPLSEAYIKEPMSEFNSGRFALNKEYTVPDDHVFFMGDNRNHSTDSRALGFMKTSAIIGKAVIYPERGSLLEAFFKLIFRSPSKTEEST